MKKTGIGTALRWERQPGETARQFAVFREYRDMHPLDRSLAEVGQKLGISTSYAERLSARFAWVDRVAAFDAEQDRLAQATRVQRIQEMNARHAEISTGALSKVAAGLKALDVSTLRPNEISRLLEVATRAERIARGVLAHDPAEVGASYVPRADDLRAALRAAGLLDHPIGFTADDVFESGGEQAGKPV